MKTESYGKETQGGRKNNFLLCDIVNWPVLGNSKDFRSPGKGGGNCRTRAGGTCYWSMSVSNLMKSDLTRGDNRGSEIQRQCEVRHKKKLDSDLHTVYARHSLHHHRRVLNVQMKYSTLHQRDAGYFLVDAVIWEQELCEGIHLWGSFPKGRGGGWKKLLQ